MNEYYTEMTLLIERLHRRFLDVVRVELNRLGVRDINAAQALVLANVGDGEVLIRDLADRGYYLGPNIFYSIRKLVEYGYLIQERDAHDKRACRITLTEKGANLVPHIQNLDRVHSEGLRDHDVDAEDLAKVCLTLKKIERSWSDYMHFGPRPASFQSPVLPQSPRRLVTDDLWDARDGGMNVKKDVDEKV